MSVTSFQRVRFGDCDPAGIAYFPRLLALVDNAIEDWLEATLGLDRAALHLDGGFGLPTVELRVGFMAPCRLGETLAVAVDVVALGTTSMTLGVAATVAGAIRFEARLVQVLTELPAATPRAWPADWRARLAADLPLQPSLVA